MKPFALLAGCLAVLVPTPSHAAAASVPETVVLLHGLGRTSWSMSALARELEQAGFRVVNPSYPWRSRTLEQLAADWLPAQLVKLPPTPRVHLVTHSMGGLLVRAWLREHGAPPNLGRVVMLAPPNAGSEIPDAFGAAAPFRWLTGPSGPRLGTAPDALPATLGPWPAPAIDLGIIAGSGASSATLGAAVPAPHDGKVSVASTHLDGARDHLVLPFSHTWIAWQRETAAQVAHFLRTGRFAAQP
ncbi:MAG: alpha/beta fold hydrolase [Opitutaceae bacterium]|nr:alpha/beta fold hydrolase [Opitutaceae bacterium]